MFFFNILLFATSIFRYAPLLLKIEVANSSFCKRLPRILKSITDGSSPMSERAGNFFVYNRRNEARVLKSFAPHQSKARCGVNSGLASMEETEQGLHFPRDGYGAHSERNRNRGGNNEDLVRFLRSSLGILTASFQNPCFVPKIPLVQLGSVDFKIRGNRPTLLYHMSFSVGIIGLPNVGKSTLFKALTKNPVDISNYPFTTIDPNVGIVQVPDERLDKLADLFNPGKVTPTVIEFVDIAGIVKEAHKGEGLGNKFLARIREVDTILHVVRAFQDENVAHVENTVDPKRDIEIIKTELAMKDIETVEKHFEKVAKEIKAGNKKAEEERKLLKKIKERLDAVGSLNALEGKDELAHLQLLCAKKMINVINSKEPETPSLSDIQEPRIFIDIKLEEELSELVPDEIKELGEESQLPHLITLCYKTLDLITFFTIKGGEELRAWTIKEGGSAQEAAFCVHSDFGEKFIRAEIISYEQLIQDESWQHAREEGHIGTQGKEYAVRDGDVIEFKI